VERDAVPQPRGQAGAVHKVDAGGLCDVLRGLVEELVVTKPSLPACGETSWDVQLVSSLGPCPAS
jgi:hypothetical protein